MHREITRSQCSKFSIQEISIEQSLICYPIIPKINSVNSVSSVYVYNIHILISLPLHSHGFLFYGILSLCHAILQLDFPVGFPIESSCKACLSV